MPKRNERVILCFDFETGCPRPEVTEPLSIGAVAIDPGTLEVLPGGEFYSLIRPEVMANVQDGALAVNKLKRADLAKAPPRELVWKSFVEFVRQFNPRGKSPFTAPIPAGKNLRSFDMVVSDRLCRQFKVLDSGGNPNLFSPRNWIDLEDDIFRWFDGREDLPSGKLDDVRDYFGMSRDGAHHALRDAQDTALLISHFFQLYRNLWPKIRFKNSLAGKVTA